MSTIGAILVVLFLSLLSVGKSKYIPLDCNDSDTICVEANGFLRCAANEQGRKFTINGEVEYCPPNSECQDSGDEVCVPTNISKTSNTSTDFHLQQVTENSEVVENEFTTTENFSTGYTESNLIGDIHETDSTNNSYDKLNNGSKEAFTHVRNKEYNTINFTSLLQEIPLEQPASSQDNENITLHELLSNIYQANNTQSTSFPYNADTNSTLFYQDGLNITNSRDSEDLLGYLTETSQTESLKNIANANSQSTKNYSNQSLGNESYPLSEDMYLNLSSKGDSTRTQVNELSGDYEHKPTLGQINSNILNENILISETSTRDVEMESFQPLPTPQESSTPEIETQFEIMQFGNREQALNNNSKSAIVDLKSIDKKILTESESKSSSLNATNLITIENENATQHEQNGSFTDNLNSNTSESSSTLENQVMQSSQQDHSLSDIDVTLDTTAKTENRLEHSNLTDIEVVDKTAQANQNATLKTVTDIHSPFITPNIPANGVESVNVTNNLENEYTETFKLEAQNKSRLSNTVNGTNTEIRKEAENNRNNSNSETSMLHKITTKDHSQQKNSFQTNNSTLVNNPKMNVSYSVSVADGKQTESSPNEFQRNDLPSLIILETQEMGNTQLNDTLLNTVDTVDTILSNGVSRTTVAPLSYQNETNDRGDIQKLINSIGIEIQSENNESVPSIGHRDKITIQSNGVVQKPTDPHGENEDQEKQSNQSFHSINQGNERMNPRLPQENEASTNDSIGDPLHKNFEGHRVDDSASKRNSSTTSSTSGGGATKQTQLQTNLALNISSDPVNTQNRPFPHQSNSVMVSSIKSENTRLSSLEIQKESNQNNFALHLTRNASVAGNNSNYTLNTDTETTPISGSSGTSSFQDGVPLNGQLNEKNQYPKIWDEESFKGTPTDMKVSIDRSSDDDVNDSGDTAEQNSDDHSGGKNENKISSKEENESTESKELETFSNFRKRQDSKESNESTESVPHRKFHCYEEGTFGHPRDSRKFFVCSRQSENGKLKIKGHKCPKFRVFDSVSLKCVGLFSAKCI